MNRRKTEDTLMTYEQWEHRFKRALKRTIKQKVNTIFEYLMFLLFMVGVPFGMFMHWLMIGY